MKKLLSKIPLWVALWLVIVNLGIYTIPSVFNYCKSDPPVSMTTEIVSFTFAFIALTVTHFFVSMSIYMLIVFVGGKNNRAVLLFSVIPFSIIIEIIYYSKNTFTSTNILFNCFVTLIVFDFCCYVLKKNGRLSTAY